MSSDNKKIFTTQATSKGAGADVTSDVISMPDGSHDHVLSVKADASCTAGVNVELEMSPDGTNWCPATTRTVSSNSTSQDPVTGNEEYVKLTPDAGEFKNKHARGGLNFDVNGAVVTPDGSGARDLMHQHIDVSKSFNYSQWFKTSENPTTTYKPVLFRHGGHDTFENLKAVQLTDTATQNLCEPKPGFTNEYALTSIGTTSRYVAVKSTNTYGLVGTNSTYNMPLQTVTFDRDWSMTCRLFVPANTNGGINDVIYFLWQDTNGLTYRFRFGLIPYGASAWRGNLGVGFVYNGAGYGVPFYSDSASYNWSSSRDGGNDNWYLVSLVYTAGTGITARVIRESDGTVEVTYTRNNVTSDYDWTTQTSMQNNNLTFPSSGTYTSIWDTKVDQCVFYDKALSLTEIQELIANNQINDPLATSFASNIISYRRFGDGPNDVFSSSVVDVMGNAQDVSVTGGVFDQLSNTDSGYATSSLTNNQDIFTATSSLSISGWFKTVNGATGTLFSNTGGAAATGLKVDVSGSAITASYLSSSLSTSVTGTFNDGNWHHIAMVLSPGSQLIVIDNVSSGTSNHTLVDDDLKGDNNFTLLSDGQNNANNISPSATDASKLLASLSNWSLHSEAISAEGIAQLYSNGHVRNIKNLPNVTVGTPGTAPAIEAWWKLSDTTTPEEDSVGTVDLFYQDGNSAALTSHVVNADGPVLVEDHINGNAMTLSLTKSFNFTTNEWVSTADQDTALCLSLNGFEEQAEHVALWKCSQTIAGSTIDICDGGWHNVILSYRGNNDLAGDNVAEGDAVKFGPGPAQSLPFNWCMSFDGQPLTAIKDGSGADFIDGLGSVITDTYNSISYNVGFNIHNRHLKYETSNTEEVYKPHAQFSAGIHEVSGVDNNNAFQGSVDETSFHSDCWWVDQAGTSVIQNTFNQEKPATIYGNTTALTNRGAGSGYPEGVPYPLLDPSAIGSSAGGNQYINPNRYDASTNPNGGLEGWWRWGDTPGDCSITINDVKDHDDSINARDIDAFGIVTADRQDMSTQTPAESIYNATIAGSVGSVVVITFPQVIISNLQVGICNLKQMVSPILKYLRVKFTGAGSCDLGENSVQAQINFRIKE
jgi:hypothetical protein